VRERAPPPCGLSISLAKKISRDAHIPSFFSYSAACPGRPAATSHLFQMADPHPLDADLDFGLQFWPAFEEAEVAAAMPASGVPAPPQQAGGGGPPPSILALPPGPGLDPAAAAAFHGAAPVHAPFPSPAYGVAAGGGGALGSGYLGHTAPTGAALAALAAGAHAPGDHHHHHHHTLPVGGHYGGAFDGEGGGVAETGLLGKAGGGRDGRGSRLRPRLN
jgi:hypothetical protein